MNNDLKKPLVENKESVSSMKSEDLLKGKKELVILHGDEEYRLKLTKNNRLLLTK